MKTIYIILILSVFMVSCGAKKRSVVTKKQKNERIVKTTTGKEEVTKKPKEVNSTTPKNTKKISIETYISTYAHVAKGHMRNHNIPASITLAQGILESGSGNGRLAQQANNHFGIKCHGWKGAKIYHDDDKNQECFRKYPKAADSYRDHSDFLMTRKRYASLFKLKSNDYKGWAKGLRKAGYATDRKYPQKLIALIERYNLNKYDAEVIAETQPKSIKVTSEYHIVKQGDTLYSLSKFYNTTIEVIKKLNGLESNDLSIGQELKIPNSK